MEPIQIKKVEDHVEFKNLIHPTATIHPSAEIADSVEIGPYTVIGENVRVGPQTRIGSHAVIEFAEIGSSCQIHSHAFVGTPPQDLKYRGENTKIIVGDGTIIRECVTLNRGTTKTGKTEIGRKCFFMAYSHIAHDCVVGDEVIMANSVAIAGHVQIGSGTVIGGLVGVHQFVRIGKLVMIGAGTMVPMDIPPFCTAWGDRARIVGLNIEGLRRHHVPKSSVDLLKKIYRKIFFSQKTLKQTLEQIESEEIQSEEVKELVAFVRKSERGICRPKLKAETSASQAW